MQSPPFSPFFISSISSSGNLLLKKSSINSSWISPCTSTDFCFICLAISFILFSCLWFSISLCFFNFIISFCNFSFSLPLFASIFFSICVFNFFSNSFSRFFSLDFNFSSKVFCFLIKSDCNLFSIAFLSFSAFFSKSALIFWEIFFSCSFSCFVICSCLFFKCFWRASSAEKTWLHFGHSIVSSFVISC